MSLRRHGPQPKISNMQSLDEDETKRVLGEVLSDQLKVIMEYVKDIPSMKRDISRLKIDMSEVKSDVKSLKLAVANISRQHQGYERHLTRLQPSTPSLNSRC